VSSIYCEASNTKLSFVVIYKYSFFESHNLQHAVIGIVTAKISLFINENNMTFYNICYLQSVYNQLMATLQCSSWQSE